MKTECGSSWQVLGVTWLYRAELAADGRSWLDDRHHVELWLVCRRRGSTWTGARGHCTTFARSFHFRSACRQPTTAQRRKSCRTTEIFSLLVWPTTEFCCHLCACPDRKSSVLDMGLCMWVCFCLLQVVLFVIISFAVVMGSWAPALMAFAFLALTTYRPVAASRPWNDGTLYVTSAPSLTVFGKRLKTYLFNRSFPQFPVVPLLTYLMTVFSVCAMRS